MTLLPKPKTVRDEKFKTFVRKLPCVACYPNTWYDLINGHTSVDEIMVSFSMSEAAHIGRTGKGIAHKGSDRETAPICTNHHTQNGKALHRIGLEKFQKFHKIDLQTICKFINVEYDGQRSNKI